MLFQNVINANNDAKAAEAGANGTGEKKPISEDQEIENAIAAIRGKLDFKLQKGKENNDKEFLNFIMANGKLKQKFLNIQRDLGLKIKEEEKRAIYIQS